MAVSSRPAQAQQLLANGNFETGSFTGWTLANQHNPSDTMNQDHFYISMPGANTPPVGPLMTTFVTVPNPAGGNFYAVSTGDNPGAHALIQNFTVPGLSHVTFSFQMFVNDQSQLGPVVDPSGLDYTTGGTFNDNQHARVDILRAGASDLSTAPADVLGNFYLGVDNPGGGVPNPYKNYAFDLTSLLGGGGTFRLRFAEVDNLSAINVGVDNVSVFASVPEPGVTALLVGSIISGLLIWRRGRRRK